MRSSIKSRIGKSTGFAVLLAVIGSTAFAVGIYVAVMTMIHAPLNRSEVVPASRGAVYVGGSTCFTCHDDQALDWSLALDAQTAATPMANPQQVAAADVSVRETTRRTAGGVAGELPASGDMLHHPYVIATEAEHPAGSGAGGSAAPPQDATCADCHAAQVESLRLKST